MTLRSQLYLLQLEDYDMARFGQWLGANPGREVIEKKGKINWTIKAKCLYFLARITGSLTSAYQLFRPIDLLSKQLLVFLARNKLVFHRNLIVIGITGSWGKTTTKEQLAIVLQQKYKVFKTRGNHNTILGVAIDVLRMPLSTQIFVCEMGAYKKGDIKQICDLVHPKIGIITAIGPMHLERFKSLESIGKAKKELFDAVEIKIGPDADWQKPICDYFKVSPLKTFPDVDHRLQVSRNNGITIIDDSYNSNPVGFKMALDKMVGEPKIVVTPGFIEMGEMQFRENKKMALITSKMCDWIIFVGETNKKAWQEGLKDFKGKLFVADIEEAKKELSQIAKPGSVVLFENDLPDQYL